eukprot:UN01785
MPKYFRNGARSTQVLLSKAKYLKILYLKLFQCHMGISVSREVGYFFQIHSKSLYEHPNDSRKHPV